MLKSMHNAPKCNKRPNPPTSPQKGNLTIHKPPALHPIEPTLP